MSLIFRIMESDYPLVLANVPTKAQNSISRLGGTYLNGGKTFVTVGSLI